MKIGRLFNLLQDAQDLLAYFENVTTPSQMTSQLERLKRGQLLIEFFDNVQSLRVSITEAFDDQLELGGELTPSGNDADSLADELLNDTPFDESVTGEETPSQTPASPNTPSSEKS
jgi:hypothetical protein